MNATETSGSQSCFSYAGHNATGLDTGRWRLAAASVTGPSHIKRGRSCDDAAAGSSKERWLAAVVCDGAGSAQCGGAGAGIVAEAVASDVIAGLGGADAWKPLKTIVQASLAAARERLVAAAAADGLRISAFATTVVGIICRGRRGIMFHLGDGSGIAFNSSYEVTAISAGGPKEYANETYFLSDETWRDYLQFTPLKRVEAILLMTDGVTPFAFDNGQPKTSFLVPILRHLSRSEPEAGAGALQRLLDKPEARKLVSDDKTLLWAAIGNEPGKGNDAELAG